MSEINRFVRAKRLIDLIELWSEDIFTDSLYTEYEKLIKEFPKTYKELESGVL